MFKNRYRITPDKYGRFKGQFRPAWWPLWIDLDFFHGYCMEAAHSKENAAKQVEFFKKQFDKSKTP